MAKITLSEWLVALTILPKGKHQHYRSEYIIDCSDIERIYSDIFVCSLKCTPTQSAVTCIKNAIDTYSA